MLKEDYIKRGLKELKNDPYMKRTIHRYRLMYDQVEDYLMQMEEDMRDYARILSDISLCLYDRILTLKADILKDSADQKIASTMLQCIRDEIAMRFIKNTISNIYIYIYVTVAGWKPCLKII